MIYCSPLYVSHQYSSKKMHNKYLWKEGRKERKNKERKEEELPMNWDFIVVSISYSAHMICPPQLLPPLLPTPVQAVVSQSSSVGHGSLTHAGVMSHSLCQDMANKK